MKTLQTLITILLLCPLSALYSQNKPFVAIPNQIGPAKPPTAALKGILWNGAGRRHYKVGEAYVFVLSADKKERVLGYTKTVLEAGKAQGSFLIGGFPPQGDVLLVGFHPKTPWTMAVQKVVLRRGWQEVQNFKTNMIIPSGDPGGAELGSSPLGLLALAGWVAEAKLANDQRISALELTARLQDYADEHPLGPGNVFIAGHESAGKDGKGIPGKTLKVKHADGLEMIWVEPGTFTMGSPSNESGRGSGETQHEVTLTKGFWLGKYEVTQAQYQAVMGSNPSYFSGDNRPVERVSWHNAMDFCGKVQDQESAAGNVPDGYAYTLPPESQWEYACRAGTTTPYAGDSLDELGWYGDNSGSRTHDVGQKLANPWGFHDMHGNVWEWCADWYSSSYPSGSVTNPVGPSSGSARVGRGGSWGDIAGGCRSADRHGDFPGFSIRSLGVRLCLSSSQQ